MRVCPGLTVLVLAACSRTLAHPPYAPQPSTALVEVSASPPPGRIEVIPPRPGPRAVWIDGEWSWRRERWAWIEGRWVDPPAAAKFSPWVFVRGADGRMWYAPGAWRSENGGAIDPPPPLTSAHVEPTQVVNASGAVETTGPTVRPPGSASAPGGGHS